MRLRWSHTWPEKGTDYTGTDPDHPHAYCRVYRSVSHTTDRRWFWAASDGHSDLGHGYAATPKEAAELAEAAYLSKRRHGAMVLREHQPEKPF